MNHCILLVEVMQPPQIRYTNENVPVAEAIVQFDTPRDNEPPATLKMVAWNQLATEVEQQGYRVGDRLIVEGRVSMVTIERQEGFREKHAELRAQRIHSLASLGGGMSGTPPAPASYAPPAPASYAPPSNVAQFPTPSAVNPPSVPGAPPAPAPSVVPPAPPAAPPASSPAFDDDDIPF